MTRKTSRLRAMERDHDRERLPMIFVGILMAGPIGLLLWWMLYEWVVR